MNVSADNNDKQDIDGEDDLEEGECSDDEDDLLPPPAPAPGTKFLILSLPPPTPLDMSPRPSGRAVKTQN